MTARPNIDKTDRLHLACECVGSCTYLHVTHDDGELVLQYISEPLSLRCLLGQLWRSRKMYTKEIVLSRSDVEALVVRLNKFLK